MKKAYSKGKLKSEDVIITGNIVTASHSALK